MLWSLNTGKLWSQICIHKSGLHSSLTFQYFILHFRGNKWWKRKEFIKTLLCIFQMYCVSLENSLGLIWVCVPAVCWRDNKELSCYMTVNLFGSSWMLPKYEKNQIACTTGASLATSLLPGAIQGDSSHLVNTFKDLHGSGRGYLLYVSSCLFLSIQFNLAGRSRQ